MMLGLGQACFFIDSAAKRKLYFPFKKTLRKSDLMTGVMNRISGE